MTKFVFLTVQKPCVLQNRSAENTTIEVYLWLSHSYKDS